MGFLLVSMVLVLAGCETSSVYNTRVYTAEDKVVRSRGLIIQAPEVPNPERLYVAVIENNDNRFSEDDVCYVVKGQNEQYEYLLQVNFITDLDGQDTNSLEENLVEIFKRDLGSKINFDEEGIDFAGLDDVEAVRYNIRQRSNEMDTIDLIPVGGDKHLTYILRRGILFEHPYEPGTLVRIEDCEFLYSKVVGIAVSVSDGGDPDLVDVLEKFINDIIIVPTPMQATALGLR